VRLPNGSGMNREVHVPFCERLQGKFQWSTQQRSDSEVKIFLVRDSRRACVFTKRSVVKMQALRNGVKSFGTYVSTPCWVETR